MNDRRISKDTLFHLYKYYGIDCKIFCDCPHCKDGSLYRICILCNEPYCNKYKFKENLCKKCEYNQLPETEENKNCIITSNKIRNGNKDPFYLFVLSVYHLEFQQLRRY